MTTTRAVWLFLIALTVIRLTMIPTKDLQSDEAHYWMWSERLAPAYFSKGPGVAFTIRAGTTLFGANEFGVRFFSPVLAAGTSLLLFYFGRRLFGENAALWLILALNVTPIFNYGAFLMTIDPLSIFFWTAAMFAFWLAIERSPQFSWYWPVTGLLIGLGFLCKYTNAFELLGVVLVLAFAPRLRPEFKRPGLYALLGAFLVCLLPPIIWNQQHAWVTMTHLRDRGGLNQGFGFRLGEIASFFFAHFGVYSPLLFLGLVIGVVGAARRLGKQLKVLFLFWFGIPVFAFYLLLSVNKAAAPNWDALAFLSLGLLAAYFWRDRLGTRAWLGKLTAVAMVLSLLMTMVALDTDLVRVLGLKWWRRDSSNRMRSWQTMALAMEKLRNEWEGKLGEKLFLIADDRDRASEVAFYMKEKRSEGPGHPPVYLVESQDIANQFYLWPRYDEFAKADPNAPKSEDDVYSEGGVNQFTGRSALFIRDGATGSLVHNIRAAFESTEVIALLEVRRYGEHVRTWRIFLCRNYRPLPL